MCYVESGKTSASPGSAYLSMCKVVAFIVVQREAQSAFILPKVIAHKVGVLGQVNSLQRQAPQALSSVNGLNFYSSMSSLRT